VNAESRMPGEGYDDAENCSVVNWPAEAAACLAFEDYPEHV